MALKRFSETPESFSASGYLKELAETSVVLEVGVLFHCHAALVYKKEVRHIRITVPSHEISLPLLVAVDTFLVEKPSHGLLRRSDISVYRTDGVAGLGDGQSTNYRGGQLWINFSPKPFLLFICLFLNSGGKFLSSTVESSFPYIPG